MKSKGPLLIVLVLIATALLLIGRDAFSSHVAVTAQDGTEVVIRLDPDDIQDWSGLRASSDLDAARKYGVSVKPPTDLPEDNDNEANLAGTKAR